MVQETWEGENDENGWKISCQLSEEGRFKKEGYIVSNAVDRLSKRRTDICPLDFAKQSLVRIEVSVEWLETSVLELVEETMRKGITESEGR